MGNKGLDKLLDRASNIAQKHQIIGEEVAKAFEERYGVTYSGADNDTLINIFDYGLGVFDTIEACDLEMLQSGYPVIKKKKPASN